MPPYSRWVLAVNGPSMRTQYCLKLRYPLPLQNHNRPPTPASPKNSTVSHSNEPSQAITDPPSPSVLNPSNTAIHHYKTGEGPEYTRWYAAMFLICLSSRMRYRSGCSLGGQSPPLQLLPWAHPWMQKSPGPPLLPPASAAAAPSYHSVGHAPICDCSCSSRPPLGPPSGTPFGPSIASSPTEIGSTAGAQQHATTHNKEDMVVIT